MRRVLSASGWFACVLLLLAWLAPMASAGGERPPGVYSVNLCWGWTTPESVKYPVSANNGLVPGWFSYAGRSKAAIETTLAKDDRNLTQRASCRGRDSQGKGRSWIGLTIVRGTPRVTDGDSNKVGLRWVWTVPNDNVYIQAVKFQYKGTNKNNNGINKSGNSVPGWQTKVRVFGPAGSQRGESPETNQGSPNYFTPFRLVPEQDVKAKKVVISTFCAASKYCKKVESPLRAAIKNIEIELVDESRPSLNLTSLKFGSEQWRDVPSQANGFIVGQGESISYSVRAGDRGSGLGADANVDAEGLDIQRGDALAVGVPGASKLLRNAKSNCAQGFFPAYESTNGVWAVEPDFDKFLAGTQPQPCPTATRSFGLSENGKVSLKGLSGPQTIVFCAADFSRQTACEERKVEVVRDLCGSARPSSRLTPLKFGKRRSKTIVSGRVTLGGKGLGGVRPCVEIQRGSQSITLRPLTDRRGGWKVELARTNLRVRAVLDKNGASSATSWKSRKVSSRVSLKRPRIRGCVATLRGTISSFGNRTAKVSVAYRARDGKWTDLGGNQAKRDRVKRAFALRIDLPKTFSGYTKPRIKLRVKVAPNPGYPFAAGFRQISLKVAGCSTR